KAGRRWPNRCRSVVSAVPRTSPMPWRSSSTRPRNSSPARRCTSKAGCTSRSLPMAISTYLRFIEKNPGSAAAFKDLVAEVTRDGALDARTKQLIFLAATAATGYGDGLIAHIDKILAAGGTPDQIREALAVIIPVVGVMPVLK